MQRLVVALLIFVFVTPAAGFAQMLDLNENQDRTFARQSLQLPAAIRPEAVRREHFRWPVLPLAIEQPPRRDRSWPGRHPVLFGTLLGMGIGVGVEQAVIPGASGGEPHSVYLPMFTAIGAGIGSLVGVIVSAVRR